MAPASPPHRWTTAEVSDVSGPAALLRNYLEQQDLRLCLRAASQRQPLRAAADVGCGYGRLTMVLSEFAADVVGFEREPDLLRQARALMPAIGFREAPSLARLPAESSAFDLAMTFTVLQHMRDAEALAVIGELKRVSTGLILLVEETDATFVDGDVATEGAGITIGRAVDTYAAWMHPWSPILSFPRRIEPNYPRPDVGSYMLFSGPGEAKPLSPRRGRGE
jgi:SAM-dependent methyltransferase